MTVDIIITNLKRQLEGMDRASAKGQDVSSAAAVDCQLLIEKCETVVPQITAEEWERIGAGTPGIKRDMHDCKDIKERYGLSWNELQMLRRCTWYDSALKRMRQEKGITQKELAEKSGVSQRTIQAYEQGRKDINKASVSSVLAMSNALGCNLSEIIDD